MQIKPGNNCCNPAKETSMSIDLNLLIKNGVHFGHQTSRWCPKMAPYIWGYKNDIHLIDVSKTAYQLEKASKFLESVAAEGRTILVVGTKKAAQIAIAKLSNDLKLPSVMHRWVGGTFSNFRQVRKAIANMLHYEDILSKSEQYGYTKKELATLKKRITRLNNIVGGIRDLSWPVGAVLVVDVKKEHVCVKEAFAMGIPIVGIVDTNSDPEMIDYVIPANDDAPRSINILMEYLGEAIARGQEIAAARPKDQLPLSQTFEMGSDSAFGLEEEEEEGAEKRSAGSRQKRAGGSRQRPQSNRPARTASGEAASTQTEASNEPLVKQAPVETAAPQE